METKQEIKAMVIANVNGKEIEILNEPDGKFVPIKPICEALGIDHSRQLQKLKEDDDLSSTMGLRPMVAADGKQREMACIPFELVFGWLFYY